MFLLLSLVDYLYWTGMIAEFLQIFDCVTHVEVIFIEEQIIKSLAIATLGTGSLLTAVVFIFVHGTTVGCSRQL